VTFTGRLTREQTFKRLNESGIFIMTSYPETLGLVYLEAMAAGNIVICSKGWGVDGLILNEQNGYCVNPYTIDDIKIVIEKVLQLTEEERTVIREKSLATVSNMDIENMSMKYLGKVINVVEKYIQGQ
jgi:glycosyltransferase involved in cell wall biosynthesis